MSKLKMPRAYDKIFKDECMFSFDSPYSDDGLYVNLVTFHGIGREYLENDIIRTGCKIYLHQKWFQVPKNINETKHDEKSVAPTKLAIGIEGGFAIENEYEIVKEYNILVVSNNDQVILSFPNSEIPEFVSNVVSAVIKHDGMRNNLQVSQWDGDNEKKVSKYAQNLVQIPSEKKISHDPKTWKCEYSGNTENLWLNLSTGFIGDGRSNWDGTGGTGAALKHYKETGSKYPLVVKLGTITPHTADVYSYAADEDNLVIDPLLSDHLSFWGIDLMKLEKTDKTMGELEVDLNMSYDWSRIIDGEEELEVVQGPGFVGLRNIGSSCYLNAAMQTILSIPEVILF
jgi:ubiquitin carboxyl-terminal hydrolase 5/13